MVRRMRDQQALKDSEEIREYERTTYCICSETLLEGEHVCPACCEDMDRVMDIDLMGSRLDGEMSYDKMMAPWFHEDDFLEDIHDDPYVLDEYGF